MVSGPNGPSGQNDNDRYAVDGRRTIHSLSVGDLLEVGDGFGVERHVHVGVVRVAQLMMSHFIIHLYVKEGLPFCKISMKTRPSEILICHNYVIVLHFLLNIYSL